MMGACLDIGARETLDFWQSGCTEKTGASKSEENGLDSMLRIGMNVWVRAILE